MHGNAHVRCGLLLCGCRIRCYELRELRVELRAEFSQFMRGELHDLSDHFEGDVTRVGFIDIFEAT